MSPFLIVPVILIAIIAANNVERGRLYRRVERLFAENKPEEVLELLDGRLAHYTFPRYNRLLLTFNAYLMQDDARHAKSTLEDLLALRTEGQQRADLLTRAFDFYLSHGLYDDAHQVLEEIAHDSDNPAFVSECNEAYEIVAKGSSAYIEDMEGRLKEAEPADRLRLLQLLTAQYENRGDKRGAERYRAQVAKLIPHVGDAGKAPAE